MGCALLECASLAKTFPDSNVIFHEGAGFGNMSDLTGALLDRKSVV